MTHIITYWLFRTTSQTFTRKKDVIKWNEPLRMVFQRSKVTCGSFKVVQDHSRSSEVILKHHKDQWKNPYYQHRVYFIHSNAIFYRTGIPELKICFILDSGKRNTFRMKFWWLISIQLVLYFPPSILKPV